MTTLFIILAVAFLLVCSALCSGLTIGILSLNSHELKRKARAGHSDAKIVYPIRALGHQLMVTLLIGNVLVNSAITALLDLRINGLLAVLVTTFFVVLFGEILPMAYLKRHGLVAAARLAPILKYVIIIFAPIARPLGRALDKWLGEEGPSIYSKEELFEIFDEHRVSEFSDIEAHEVEIVKHALTYGTKQVREVMTPRKVVTSVSSDDIIGPILIDELHKTGHSRFPVYEAKNKEKFVGTLYLHDLVNLKKTGSVASVMRKEVYYVHEEQPLDHALHAFLQTNHHLFIVVNTFEEFVGVISFEDVIEQILGKQIVDEFDQHADLRAVAKSIAEKERIAREKRAAKDKK